MSGRVHQIYSMLEPRPKELLDNPRRSFVKEGPIILWNEVERKKKDRWFFMFNDTLLIAKRLNGRKPKYRLRVYITLRPQVKVVDVKDSHDPSEFRIMAPTKTFVLFGRTRQDKVQWIRWINNTIYGRSLDDRSEEKKGKKTKPKKVEESEESGSYSYEEEEEEEPLSESEEEQDSFDNASEDEESEEEVFTDNPDVESFVPVLPDQFFTPSGAKRGVRAGGRRRAGTGAAANRRRGTGSFVPAVERKARSQTVAPPPAVAAAPAAAPAASSGLGDLLTFDDPVPQQQQQQPQQQNMAAALFGGPQMGVAQNMGGGLFGGQNNGMPQMGLQQQAAPGAFSQNPFGGMMGQPQQQQQQQNPFGGFPQQQQQQQQTQQQNPFF